MKKIAFLVIGAAAFFASCKKDDNNSSPAGTFNGPDVQFFGGKANTWVKINSSGAPEQLAISINDAAMNSLPTDINPDGEDDIILPLNTKASATAFDHVMVDWNPLGHEPDGVYTVPHFDFHFYMNSVDEQMSIPLYEEDSLKFKNYPSADYMPQNYIPIPGGVPMMGSHWVDITSPELNGAPFTQTFLMGSYDGKVIFYEPMITLDFLKNNANFERDIPAPAKYQKPGYYPTKLKVSKHDGVTEIILDGFVNKQQS